MPALASPATASPATIATVIGRNTGRTSASAAAGKSWPLLTTAERKAPPRPGGGARPVTASRTATSVGSAHSSAQHSQTRRRRSSRPSSTAVTTGPARRCASAFTRSASIRSAPCPVRSSTTCSRVRRSGISSATRIPAATSRAFSAAGSSWRTTRWSPERSTTRPSSSATAAAGSAVRRSTRPVGARSAVRSSSSTSRPASITPTRWHSGVDLAEQVAGQHDGRAGLVQPR